jgi:hypothetical protein
MLFSPFAQDFPEGTVDSFWFRENPKQKVHTSGSNEFKRIESTIGSTKEERRKLIMGIVTTLADKACCSIGETKKFLHFLHPLLETGTMFNTPPEHGILRGSIEAEKRSSKSDTKKSKKVTSPTALHV